MVSTVFMLFINALSLKPDLLQPSAASAGCPSIPFNCLFDLVRKVNIRLFDILSIFPLEFWQTGLCLKHLPMMSNMNCFIANIAHDKPNDELYRLLFVRLFCRVVIPDFFSVVVWEFFREDFWISEYSQSRTWLYRYLVDVLFTCSTVLIGLLAKNYRQYLRLLSVYLLLDSFFTFFFVLRYIDYLDAV